MPDRGERYRKSQPSDATAGAPTFARTIDTLHAWLARSDPNRVRGMACGREPCRPTRPQNGSSSDGHGRSGIERMLPRYARPCFRNTMSGPAPAARGGPCRILRSRPRPSRVPSFPTPAARGDGDRDRFFIDIANAERATFCHDLPSHLWVCAKRGPHDPRQEQEARWVTAILPARYGPRENWAN